MAEYQFKDRKHAGLQLARYVAATIDNNTVVVACARGGVPVGFEIAKQYRLPLEVLVTRKIGAPFQREYAIGAISENEVIVLDEDEINEFKIPMEIIDEIIDDEEKELRRRVELYRHGHDLSSFEGKKVLLVDDGLATGLSAIASIESVKRKNPEKIVYAVPVSPVDTAQKIIQEVDGFISIMEVDHLHAIGQFYVNFKQVTDKQVMKLLEHARESISDKNHNSGKVIS